MEYKCIHVPCCSALMFLHIHTFGRASHRLAFATVGQVLVASHFPLLFLSPPFAMPDLFRYPMALDMENRVNDPGLCICMVIYVCSCFSDYS